MSAHWILLVNRDPRLQYVLEEALQGAGFHVTVAEDDRGIVQALELHPAAIVSDRPLKAASPDIPFVLTGKEVDEDKIKDEVLTLVGRRELRRAAAAKAAAAPPRPAPKPPKHWLLVVGGDAAATSVVKLAILGMGLEMAAARDAAQALLRVRTLMPKLIVWDLDALAFESGVLLGDVPCLLIGAEAKAPPASVRARFLAKPFDAQALQSMILSLLTGEPADAPEPESPPRGVALVLDGDPAVRAALSGALAGIGFEAVAGDAAQAVRLAGDLKPALIVSDLRAPGAVETLAEIRLDALLAGIPFLFVGDLPPEEAIGLLPWGDPTVRYARKPLDLERVAALAAELTC